MRDLLVTEVVKLRRSGVPWFLLAAGLIPAITNTFYPNDFSWDRCLLSALLFMNLSGFIVLTPLAGYSVCREYESRTWSALLACPAPRWKLLLAKYLVFVPQVLATVLLCLAASVLGGILMSGTLPPGGGFLARQLSLALSLSCLHLCMAPAAMLAGFLGRRTVGPVLVGLAYLILYRTFLFTSAGTFVPSCIPSLFLLHATGIDLYRMPFSFDGRAAAAVMGGLFLACSVCSVAAFRIDHA
jgi:ABC-type transport system involved in multi-copper enzyme maturation permease subunit